MRNLLRDSIAGTLAATIVATYAVSYSALFAPGAAAQAGASLALWAIMAGAAVGGGWSSWRSSLGPVANGMDSAQAATYAALGATATATLAARGAGADEIARHLLVAFSFAGLVYAAASFALGRFRLAGHLRLAPDGVVAGFLAATGLALVAGGLKLAVGAAPTPAALAGLSAGGLARVAAALVFAAAVLASRRLKRSSFALPALIAAAILAGEAALRFGGLEREGWYPPGARPEAWLPLLVVARGGLDLRFLATLAPDALAIACVGLVSNVVKVVALEGQRDADLDREFQSNGAGNLAAALVGGLPASPLIAPTNVLTQGGAASRRAGVICAAVLGAAAVTRLDLPGAILLPALGGLVAAMGVTQAWRPLADVARRGSRGDMAFVALVMAACLTEGFVAGVLLGFVGACLIFAFNYARLGVVRRQATRASVSSNVEYAPDLELYLAQAGDTIHIFWLEGYLFFGSADALFKQARAAAAHAALEHVALDFSGVSGLDGSALQSLEKLSRHLDGRGVAIAYAGLKPQLAARFAAAGLIGAEGAHRAFATRDEALEWCEERTLEKAFGSRAHDEEPEEVFLRRLAAALGEAGPQDMLAYLARRRIDAPGVLYEQGAPADAMEFVARGDVLIAYRRAGGALQILRKMRRDTIVGEMGFFREGVRSASVVVARPAVLYTLTRDSYLRMCAERPALAAALNAFVVRTLADRLEFANRQVASLL